MGRRHLVIALVLLLQAPAFGQSWGQFKQAANDSESSGDLAQAEKHWRESLAIAQTDGETGTRYNASLAGLAGVLTKQGRFTEAQPLFEKLVDARAKGNNEELDPYLSQYIEALRANGQNGKAQDLENKFPIAKVKEPDLSKQASASNQTDPWTSVTQKGCQALQSRLYPQAEAEFRKALALAESQDQQTKIADSLARLVHVLCTQKKLTQAELFQAQKATLMAKHRGSSSTEYADALMTQAKILRRLNRTGEAISCEGKAEQILWAGGYSDTAGSGPATASESSYVTRGGEGTRGGSIYSRARSASQSAGTGGGFADLMNDLLNQ